ncbi:MAG: sigma-70 family RNA polymerase sigma factor [Rhodospirillales bacterium]|nr:sigma-70 family RNA polymerase sigma factor [Rhodospirillales bacterium]MDE2576888.1 sigma-70 family RNA polymerase sigma factor [Rhodospirillales bacterium]
MTDAELETPEFLAQLRAGDERAYRRLIRRFHGSLVGVASSIIGSRAQAEEVVQDSWLAVFSNIARFEGRSSLASWLFTIVLNRARTRIVREARTVALPAILDGAQGEQRAVGLDQFIADGHWAEHPRLWDELDPERVVGGRQLWAHVQEVVERLPAGQKAVIILRDMEGVSAEAACEMLAISPENQRVLLHRARGRVRAAIDLLTSAPLTSSGPGVPTPGTATPGAAASGAAAQKLPRGRGVGGLARHAAQQLRGWLVGQRGGRGALAQRLQRLLYGADARQVGVMAL